MTIGNPKHDKWVAARKAGATPEEAARAALPGEPEGSDRLKYWVENGDRIAGYVRKRGWPKGKPRKPAEQPAEQPAAPSGTEQVDE